MKKTFIFYNDWEDYTEEMSLEEKGLLLQTILNYQKGKELGNIDIIKFVWSRIKKQIDLDNEKWKEEVKKRSLAGIEGNKKRRGKNTQSQTITNHRKCDKNIASVTKLSQLIAVNVNDNDNINNKNIISNDIIEQSSYGNNDINNLLNIIKKYNNGIIDGKQEEQRRYGKLLIQKLKQIDSVKDLKFTREQIIEMILQIVSENKFHSHKIVGPKKIYYELSGLMMICKQEIKGKKQKEVQEF